ncbi:MAG: SDR family NAD(P)-dependent oxidoreductase [Acidimicrobiia bacterium]|nr:SDR family NAD(P)-dependent oxidoreductase [Acidimicrobiia bacterium]
MPMHDKTCLVTGASSGIGKATALGLAHRGARVALAVRDHGRGEAAADEIRQRVPGARLDVLTADLTKLSDVRALASRVRDRYRRLDVLVNNAGVVMFHRQVTPEGLETTFAANHLGPFLLTNLLRDPLAKSAPARVITVSSSGHKHVRNLPWNDLSTAQQFRPLRVYQTTKLLNVLFTAELSRRLAASGVTANCADPGFVRTHLGRHATGGFGLFLKITRPFQVSVEAGAETSIYLASSSEVAEVTGGYFAKSCPAVPSALSQDREAAERLWQLSTQLSGLDTEHTIPNPT